MSRKEFVAELVGWLGNEFKERASLALDEETANGYEGLAFENADSVVRRLRFGFDSKKITSVLPLFEADIAVDERPQRAARGLKQKEFTFRKGERFAELNFYFSFSGGRKEPFFPASTVAPVVERIPNSGGDPRMASTEGPAQPMGSESELVSQPGSGIGRGLLTGAAVKKGEVSEWGMHKAQLCGIQFRTTEGRPFKLMASDPSVFKTRYKVNVGSGSCFGVIQEKDASGKHLHFAEHQGAVYIPYQVP